MRTQIRWRTVGGALLAAGIGLVVVCDEGTAADDKASVYKSVLPDDAFAQLVADDAKAIKDSLTKAQADAKSSEPTAKASYKKMLAKARCSAGMVAVYAQGAMTKPGAKVAEMAGLRDAAIQLIKALDGDKVAQAMTLANDLKPAGKADPAAKTTPVAVHEHFEIDVLMQQFKPDRGGGLAVESKMLAMVNKRSAYTATDYQQMVPVLYRIAAIAQPTEAMVPSATGGKKTPAKWKQLSQEMGTLALDAVALAKDAKPDPKKVKAALVKLEANCTECHVIFRDE